MATVNFQELMGTMNAEQAKPRTKPEIIALLQTAGDGFASYLEGLTDAFLGESVKMMPGAQPAKSRFELLLGAMYGGYVVSPVSLLAKGCVDKAVGLHQVSPVLLEHTIPLFQDSPLLHDRPYPVTDGGYLRAGYLVVGQSSL